MGADLKISLWHPFSAEVIGLSEDLLFTSHSRPHIRALQYLANQYGIDCQVEYISHKLWPYTKKDNGVTWRFWPLSFRWHHKSRKWRGQRSVSGLLNMRFNPANVTIINTSGHGGVFAFQLAKQALARGQKYITMMGGLSYTADSQNVIDYYQNAASIITHTKRLADEMRQVPAYAQCKFDYLPLGVDTDQFIAIDEYHFDSESIHLLFVGRILPLKQIHLAIDAVAKVKQQFPMVVLDIIGPTSDEVYKAKLEQQATDLGVENNVKFHGSVPYADLVTWYQNADLFLFPSEGDIESFGMVVVESLACGVPVVGLRGKGGQNEIISHNQDGILVDPANFSDAIMQLLTDHQRLEHMHRIARLNAVSKFSISATGKNLYDIILETLQG